MARHDDALHEISRDRLHAVAARRAVAGSVPMAAPVRERRRRAAPSDPLAWLDEVAVVTGGDPRAPGTVSEPPRATDAVAGDGRTWAAGDDALVSGHGTRPGDDPLRRDEGVVPGGEDGALAPADAGDARDVVARMRAEALGTAATAYAGAYGHPLEHGRRAPAGAALRWGLTVRHAVVASVAVAVLATGVAVRAGSVVPDAPRALTTQVTPVDGAGGGGGAPPAGSAAGPVGEGAAQAAGAQAVMVHVVGQVAAPGVVELPAGSRVGDALRAAGGATGSADLSAVNLARVVLDGEQIVVPAPGEVPPSAVPGVGTGASAGTAGSPSTAAPLDLNRAGPAELDALPGIGPVLAQRIVDWRSANGPFRDVEELGEVAGIGDAVLSRLRPLVRV